MAVDYRRAADRIARRNDIPPWLFRALINQESRWDPNARSGAGAIGFGQLMPGTARGLGVNPNDPIDNLRGSARYLSQQIHTFGGDLRKALAAYNAGPGAVQKYGGVPPYEETQNYVSTILGNRPSRINAGGGGGGGGSAPSQASPGAPATALTPQGSEGLVGLLQALSGSQQPSQPASAGVPAPSFSARPVLAGQQVAPTSGGPAQTRPSIQTLLSAAQVTGQTPQVTGGGSGPTTAPGVNVAPGGSQKNNQIAAMVQEANLIDQARTPYLWGGGHQATQVARGSKVTPLDCSGAVSRVLGIDPRVSGQFVTWGKAGRAKGGKGVTVYANDEHVLMEINGHFFGTSSTNPGGGAGWIKRKDVSADYLKNFTARHL